MADSDNGLTPKQARFVEEYLIDLNATQAAIRAGYSEKAAGQQGFENLRKPDIQEALTEAMNTRSERTKISQDWVLERLVKNVDHAMQAEPVLRDGAPVGDYSHQPSAANRGLELIGKHLGMFVERAEIESRVRVLSDQPMTDDEWEAKYCTNTAGGCGA